MKTLNIVLFFCAYITLNTACKTTSINLITPEPDQDIIGSWEGCDGRVVKFSKKDNDKIVGHYMGLGRLDKYKFTLNEEGYRLSQQSSGVYKGLVKWKTVSGEETWEEVTITVENNIYKDSGSDSCSKEMKRINV